MRENPEINFIYRPVMMTSLFGHFGIKAPGEVAPKREFMLRQCYRFASKKQIEFTPPAKHPFNPLYALRLATKTVAQERQEQVIDALWSIGWIQGKDLGDPDLLVSELNRLDLRGEQLLERSFDAKAKKEIKFNISEAHDHKVFGVPSWIHAEELFWGNDSLEDLNNSLMGKDDWNRLEYQKAIKNNPLEGK